MANEGKNVADELSTWQQIADYLGVSVRTVQTWAKQRHLPVRKIGGRVSAKVSDLESWKKVETSAHVPTADTVEQHDPNGSHIFTDGPVVQHGIRLLLAKWRRWAVGIGFALVAVVSVAAWWQTASEHGNAPNSYRAVGKVLTVYRASGRALWQYTFPAPLYEPSYTAPLPACVFADLDGDGTIETVCRYHPDDQFPDQRLYCFDQRTAASGGYSGPPHHSLIWQGVRRPVLHFADPGHTAGQNWAPQDHHKQQHHWSFPDQVAVLDYRGRLIGEYWHHGHLPHLLLLDLNGDGKLRLIAAGLNDSPGYKRATLLIFDPDHVSGSSLRIDGTPDFDDMTAGSEQTVVFFPKTRISQTAEFNRVVEVSVFGSGTMAVHVCEGIREDLPYVVYEFAKGIRLQDLTFSDALKAAYRERFGTAAGNQYIGKDTERPGEVVVANGSVEAVKAMGGGVPKARLREGRGVVKQSFGSAPLVGLLTATLAAPLILRHSAFPDQSRLHLLTMSSTEHLIAFPVARQNMHSTDELHGWDEIADYLNVTRRTAQNYERSRGLVVRRLPGTKGRVWAIASEIDAWKQVNNLTSGRNDSCQQQFPSFSTVIPQTDQTRSEQNRLTEEFAKPPVPQHWLMKLAI